MDKNPTARRGVDRLSRWVIWTLGAAALGYLIVEHRPHLFGWLPYLIILACPLMHLFMHRGHHGHHEHHHDSASSDRTPKDGDAGADTSGR
jgi:hypothetical protein